MSVMDIVDEVADLINNLSVRASNTGTNVNSGYPTHVDDIGDIQSFGNNLADKLNAFIEHSNDYYILLKRNNLLIKLEWSIGYHGDVEMSIKVDHIT
jgi:hypothetical protein